MRKLSEILKESYFPQEPTRDMPEPQSDKEKMLEEFKENKAEVIKAWTKIKHHPEAKDFKSEVGSAFDESDLDEEISAAFDVLEDGGFIYASFEGSLWIKHKGQLIRVM